MTGSVAQWARDGMCWGSEKAGSGRHSGCILTTAGVSGARKESKRRGCVGFFLVAVVGFSLQWLPLEHRHRGAVVAAPGC